ncbi:SDR family NAD(P)-dependent oxidoreductase [Mycobacterium shimoidei]|uniref:Short-chain dehydrogenase/reductase SDR [Conexibacter woesei DSM] n=1 Tax=Mycobacterium shimoidei TaxID=29313 RepID=A0A1E3TEY2_MYCSH|nr:SDR family NAD(P)-dependent oxidoreductase [Mycobacterium shimoidei]MCV7260377.1 SDR family NAD(P)-dependent oxidoreductase [Mycobacterium shimoidei]ODR12990.1 short-chain dehydrogenase/reductase [Mycobacterium shimoidei]ORW82137.1 dehydrogenase [Mycobacterium shimoidei]SRX95448.1 short-chain dehydrogenase/reductase SDR [Conexibacter woesei DSM] [Mycobacterium shimoidei]
MKTTGTKPIALITGATSGIGEATAYRLQALDYEVFAAGRNPEALDSLRSRGLQARALDVTDEAAVARLIDEIHTDYGAVDVVVNSAGYPLPCPLEQVALNDLRKLFETNVVATLNLSQAVLPAMRARGSGRIITIGSTGGRFSSPGAGAYHIVKYGVEALCLSLRAEVAQFGVRVVLIDPTGVRTRFVTSQLETTHTYADDDPYADFKRRYAATTRALTETPGMMVSADTVARAVVRAVKARNPKPRYIVGASGKASVLARALLSDRMWDRVMSRGLS